MQLDFQHFFQEITGFNPYAYQTAVADKLFEGKNIILSVPTGAGKTYASVVPFLFGDYQSDFSFPNKMIYSLPLRALTNSIYNEVACNKAIQGYCPEIARQTGEFSDDPYFENRIIFSTIDQTLSSFLCFPLSLSQREANINAGALIGSYLVFDEFHLLDPKLSMATTVGTLTALENLSRFCLMTATMSESMKSHLKNELINTEVIDIEEYPEDTRNITSFLPPKDKKKVRVKNQPLQGKDILNNHDERTIVICNRVEKVQQLYTEVKNNLQDPEVQVFCLHSRFFDEDRKNKESKIEKYFGKKSTRNAILISTHVIEAGMDISCKVMHTEISPANSFLQRAGRCARFKDETGQIFVYHLLEIDEQEKIQFEPQNTEDKEEIKRINNKYLPYDQDLTETTFAYLKQNLNTLDGTNPKTIIEEIHRQQEEELFARMKTDSFNWSKIQEAWKDCEKNHYRETIRDIQNVEICLISDQNEEEVRYNPYQYQTISMFKWSFVGWLKRLQETVDFENWLIKELTETFIYDMGDEMEYDLMPISDFQKLPPLIFANAEKFGYSPEVGFNFSYPETFNYVAPLKQNDSKKEQKDSLKKDTFIEHNLGLLNCFKQEFFPQLDFTFNMLKKFLQIEDLNKEQFFNLFYLMFILHDYGKLNDDWQVPMKIYQSEKEGKKVSEILAHTDFFIEDHNDLELSKNAGLSKRPPHAPIGANVVSKAFGKIYDEDELEELRLGITYAIAKHHSSKLNEGIKIREFKISEEAYKEFQTLSANFDFNIELDRKGFPEYLNEKVLKGKLKFITYFLFVRILRLCDQKATKNLSKYL